MPKQLAFKVVEIISDGTLLIMSVHYLMIKPLITLYQQSMFYIGLVNHFDGFIFHDNYFEKILSYNVRQEKGFQIVFISNQCRNE